MVLFARAWVFSITSGAQPQHTRIEQGTFPAAVWFSPLDLPAGAHHLILHLPLSFMRFNPLKPTQAAKPTRPAPLAKGTIPNPAPIGTAPVLNENLVKDRFELRFPRKPSDEAIDLLLSTKILSRDQQWHFHFKGKYWYARRGEVTRKLAHAIIELTRKPSSNDTHGCCGSNRSFNNPSNHKRADIGCPECVHGCFCQLFQARASG